MASRALKWVVYMVPVILFALFLNSGQILKRPMGSGDDIFGSLHAVEQAVLSDDWAGAARGWEKTHKATGIVSRRIEVQAERNELQDFFEEMARLQGSIQAQEKGTALEHIAVLKSLYDEFGK